MRIIGNDNNKQRLFEVFEKVNNVILTEAKLSKVEKEDIVKDFVKYVAKDLNLKNIPKVIVSYHPDEAKTNKSFASYNFRDYIIRVVIFNRNLADALRSLAHELKHHEQNLNGKLNPNSGITGSNEENEANAYAGIVLRNYGKINPNIYE